MLEKAQQQRLEHRGTEFFRRVPVNGVAPTGVAPTGLLVRNVGGLLSCERRELLAANGKVVGY